MITCTQSVSAGPGLRTARAHNRGMILLLVVAILVLLAVMGTAYILMARVDRQSTYDAAANANLTFAQQASLNIVRNLMLTQTEDANGNMFGPNVNQWSPGLTYGANSIVYTEYNGVKTYFVASAGATGDPAAGGTGWSVLPYAPSRLYDYPQSVSLFSPTASYLPGQMVASGPSPNIATYIAIAPSSGQTPTTGSASWAPAQSESWLVNAIPWELGVAYPAGATVFYNGQDYIATTAVGANSAPGSGSWTAVSAGNLYSTLTPEYYDTTTGAYDIAPSSLSANASVCVPSHVGSSTAYGTPDAVWNLLPYSDPNGTRYRYALRIIDTNSLANLNAGAVGGLINNYGQYMDGTALDASAIMGADTAAALQTARQGSIAVTYNLPNWQQVLMQFNNTTAAWFGLSTELELRSYGDIGGGFYYGSPYLGAAGNAWPKTLGPPTTTYSLGSTAPYLNRMFYTSYSWDRSIRPAADPAAFTLNGATSFTSPGGNPQYIWPTFPRKIFINAASQSGLTASQQAEFAAATATDLATAMRSLGYTPEEYTAEAINFLDYMYNYAATSNGPCLIGPNGIWMGSSGLSFSGGTDINSALVVGTGPGQLTLPGAVPASNLYIMGEAAQPFIEEVAVNASRSSTGQLTFNNCAVVLFNPFKTAISLTGWNLRLYSASTTSYSGSLVALSGSVPANGYTVFEEKASPPIPVASGITPVDNASLAFQTAGTSLQAVLTRPGVSPAGPGTNYPVDDFDYTAFLSSTLIPNGTNSQNYFISRYNSGTGPGWYCADGVHVSLPALLSTPLATSVSVAVVGDPVSIPLYDRFADYLDAPGYAATPASYAPLLNLADFNRVSRLFSAVGRTTSGAFVPIQMISQTIGDLTKDPNEPYTTLQYEANARFDFMANPLIGAVQPDDRAQGMLQYITMTNQASYADTNDGGGPSSYNTTFDPYTLDKLRMPGRINVNTASLPVLDAMLASLTAAPLTAANETQIATDIASFRDRTVGTSYADGTSTGQLGGMGISSMADLAYAISGPYGGIFNLTSTLPTTMDQRDEYWASLANMCTVRSDTFAVYGLIEALRPNGVTPRDTDWYSATQASGKISIDPNSTTAEFVLEGSQRFVAVIDRSGCNLGWSATDSALTYTPGGAGQTEPSAVYRKPVIAAIKLLPN